MNVDLGIWDKLTRAVVVLLFLAALTAVALWYMPAIQENEQSRKKKLDLEQTIAKEQERFRQLDVELRAMQDSKTVERLARERLGLGRTGEIIYQFEAPATNAHSAQAERVRQ
jgi:cell division protein FtsB